MISSQTSAKEASKASILEQFTNIWYGLFFKDRLPNRNFKLGTDNILIGLLFIYFDACNN